VSIRASAGRFAIVTVDDGAAPRAMPNQGASSGFKYGGAVGAIEAVLACCEIPMTGIEPSAWKEGPLSISQVPPHFTSKAVHRTHFGKHG
jgi:hypothetical protein